MNDFPELRLLGSLALFAGGHIVRDGWPPTGNTQAARLLGAILCGLAVWLLGLVLFRDAMAIGAAIAIGFWTDNSHARGQQARGWADAGWLAISGATSLLPLAALAWWLVGHWQLALLILMLGAIAKPPIWFVSWWASPPPSPLAPTRMAAALFGLVVGVAASIVASAVHG